MKTGSSPREIPADVRRVIVRQLAAALATAWRARYAPTDDSPEGIDLEKKSPVTLAAPVGDSCVTGSCVGGESDDVDQRTTTRVGKSTSKSSRTSLCGTGSARVLHQK